MSNRTLKLVSLAAAVLNIGVLIHVGRPSEPEPLMTEAAAATGLQEDLGRILRDMAAKNPKDAKSALAALEPYVRRLIKEDPKAVILSIRGWGEIIMSESSGTELHLARRRANERAAISTLRCVVSAQAQFQAMTAIDLDDDGVGEYATFAELAGAKPLRGGTERLDPPMLASSLGRVQERRLTRFGYYFQMFLPDATGKPVAERKTGGSRISLSPASAADALEAGWCVYAWPVEGSPDGQRAFFANERGEVLSCKNRHANRGRGYIGNDGPAADAAFAAGGTPGTINGKIAADTIGRDGGRWDLVR